MSWAGDEANFSGTAGSEVATAGPLADTTGSFTVAAWAPLNTTTSADQAVASQAAGTNNGFTLQYDPATGNWEFARPLSDTAGASSAVAGSGASATAATGAWTFLVGTYDANTGTMTLYVNGTAAGTATDATPVAAHGAFDRRLRQGERQRRGSGSTGRPTPCRSTRGSCRRPRWASLENSSGDITTGAADHHLDRVTSGACRPSVTSPDGAVTGYTYDEAGQLTQTTGPTVTTQVYGGSPVTAHPPTGRVTTRSVSVAEAKDPDGNVTTYGYDADGRQVSVTLPPYTPPGGSPVTAVDTTAYDGDGLVTSVTDGA